MNPILLQKQLKENSSDLDSFYKELQSWSDKKKKEEEASKKSNSKDLKETGAIKKKIIHKEKRVTFEARKPEKNPKAKTSVIDYSNWDKFDADAECEKLANDQNSDSDLTDEYDETIIQEANAQKEEGNKHVKAQNWDKAIVCYSKAININDFDPTFYANRALCFQKKQNFIQAEEDCTKAIELDDKYTKAYHRRAIAREHLNKLKEAEQDILKALLLEPQNKEVQKVYYRLVKKIKELPGPARPVSKFTASRLMRKPLEQTVNSQVELNKPDFWPSGSDGLVMLKAINKPVHLRSKASLKRIEVEEVESMAPGRAVTAVKEEIIERKTPLYGSVLKTDDLKVVERVAPENLKETKNNLNAHKVSIDVGLNLVQPKNSVQFYDVWRQLKRLEQKCSYLKLVKPANLSSIFKESMDSGVFSSILEVLADFYTKDGESVFEFLEEFTRIKRFSTFTLFFTDMDKKCLWKLFDHVKEKENVAPEKVDALIKKYEL